MLRTTDGHGCLELSRFIEPAVVDDLIANRQNKKA